MQLHYTVTDANAYRADKQHGSVFVNKIHNDTGYMTQNANPNKRFIPITSQSGPPKIMASVKPQNAGLNIQPSCSFDKTNWVLHTPSRDALKAKCYGGYNKRNAAGKKKLFTVNGIHIADYFLR